MSCRPAEVEYFAHHSWNLAKMAADAHDLDSCMKLFLASAGFYGLHPEKGQPQLQSQKVLACSGSWTFGSSCDMGLPFMRHPGLVRGAMGIAYCWLADLSDGSYGHATNVMWV
jgi:hypothetical protein